MFAFVSPSLTFPSRFEHFRLLYSLPSMAFVGHSADIARLIQFSHILEWPPLLGTLILLCYSIC